MLCSCQTPSTFVPIIEDTKIQPGIYKYTSNKILEANDQSINKYSINPTNNTLNGLVYIGKIKRIKLYKNNILYVTDGVTINYQFVKKINNLLKKQDLLFKYPVNVPITIWLLKNLATKGVKGLKSRSNIMIESNEFSNEKEILSVISHELMHRWFGSIIRQDYSNKVFFEGYTEYYAQKSLLEAGIINLLEYLDNYNNVLKEYYLSHVYSATNQEISNHYWHNHFLMRLAYLRGQIIAQELNNRLLQYTFNKVNLESLIAEIITKSKKQYIYFYHFNTV